MKLNLGTLLTVSGAAIHTSYYASSTASLNGGRPDKFRFLLDTKTIALSNITSVQLSVFGSSDGVTYYPVLSVDDASTSSTPTKAAEQTWNIGAAGTEQQNGCTCDAGYPFMQVKLKSSGGVGQALESLTLSAEAL